MLRILANEGLDDLAPLEGRPGYGLLSLDVVTVRAHGCGVVRDPTVSEPSRADDPAHCLVVFPFRLDKPTLKLVRDSLLQAAHVLRRHPGST